MKVAIDFDGVLHDPKSREHGMAMGKPIAGARDAVVALIAAGHELWVFTQRGGHPDHVIEWLDFFGFPALPVTMVKGDFDLIIDDKALRFTGWPATLAAVTG